MQYAAAQGYTPRVLGTAEAFWPGIKALEGSKRPAARLAGAA
jgi:hypothetical protein